jgi:hypothetical protein
LTDIWHPSTVVIGRCEDLHRWFSSQVSRLVFYWLHNATNTLLFQWEIVLVPLGSPGTTKNPE